MLSRSSAAALGFAAIVAFGLFVFRFNDWRQNRLPEVRVGGEQAERVDERAGQLDLWKWGGLLISAGGLGCFFFVLPTIRLKESVASLSPLSGKFVHEITSTLGAPQETETLDGGAQRLTWSAVGYSITIRVEDGRCARVERTREGASS